MLDQISLEFAGSRVPIELLALISNKKDVLFGAIDVTKLEIETPEEVAAIIREAIKYTSPERIFPCTNCGMVPLPRSVANGKLKALSQGAEIVRSEL